MGLHRPTLSVTLCRSVPSLDVHIFDRQRRVCYPYRERIPRQLALELSRSHPRRLGTASRSIFVIPVTAFKHSGGSLKLICSTCHLFSYFVQMNYSLTDLHSVLCCLWHLFLLVTCLRTASSFWDSFLKSLFDNNNNNNNNNNNFII